MNRSFSRTVSIAVPLVSTLIAVACGLDEGTIDALSSASDAATTANGDGATSNDAAPSDGNIIVGDEPPIDGDVPDSGVPPRYIFASTTTKAYALELHSTVLRELGSFSNCGTGFDTFDLAQDSNGGLHALGWKASGSFSYFLLERDGGCVDVHGGPGSNPAASSMWVGYQKAGTTDTLFSILDNNGSLFSYNSIGDYITMVNGVFSGGGATADIACTTTLCYTALAHARCPSPPAADDCLVSFQSNGASLTQVGDFGKSGVTGIAYDQGFVYGFASDGSITKISTVAPSSGQPFAVIGVSTTGLVWQGAASSSANE